VQQNFQPLPVVGAMVESRLELASSGPSARKRLLLKAPAMPAPSHKKVLLQWHSQFPQCVFSST
jgi:hypothetical protein